MNMLVTEITAMPWVQCIKFKIMMFKIEEAIGLFMKITTLKNVDAIMWTNFKTCDHTHACCSLYHDNVKIFLFSGVAVQGDVPTTSFTTTTVTPETKMTHDAQTEDTNGGLVVLGTYSYIIQLTKKI